MLFNVLIDEEGKARYSPLPGVDRLLLGRVKVLHPGLPLGLIRRILERLPARTGKNGGEGTNRRNNQLLENQIIYGIRKGIAREGGIWDGALAWHEVEANSNLKFGRSELPEIELMEIKYEHLLKFAEGRQCSENEFTFLQKVIGGNLQELIAVLHLAVLRGTGQWLPALVSQKSCWQCQRCGSYISEEWLSVYGRAATCPECSAIGALNSLQALFRTSLKHNSAGDSGQGKENRMAVSLSSRCLDWRDGIYSGSDVGLAFDFSAAQNTAAQELAAALINGKTTEGLVWAACGAGKTEICFPVIKSYLLERKKVLFAAPRLDVVHDVYQRLQKNFSGFRVRILSGAAPPDPEDALLTVATTHQVLRFFRSFDLVVFDEMDAYPYDGNSALEYGMRQALREDGRIIYLSATPSAVLLKKARRGDCLLIRLPARFHGHPLPVPEYCQIKLPECRMLAGRDIWAGRELNVLKQNILELATDRTLLVFVPTVAMVAGWIEELRRIFGNYPVEGSWASDPDRRRKVASLLAGEYRIFVCTSILERGVTINGAQVMVLYADHCLFDLRALVQMAGRAGRTREFPDGRVIFLASKKTGEITGAIKWIQDQNSQARQRGLLSEIRFG